MGAAVLDPIIGLAFLALRHLASIVSTNATAKIDSSLETAEAHFNCLEVRLFSVA